MVPQAYVAVKSNKPSKTRSKIIRPHEFEKIGNWHSRRCVWDKIASKRSGEEPRSIKRKRCQKQRNEKDFVTFCDDKCETLGRTRRLCKIKHRKQEPRIFGPPDSPISLRTEGTTVHVYGESKKLQTSGSMGPLRWDKRTREKLRVFRGHCICGGRGKLRN